MQKPLPYKFIDAKLINGSIHLTIEKDKKAETLVLEFGSDDDDLWDLADECLLREATHLAERPLR